MTHQIATVSMPQQLLTESMKEPEPIMFKSSRIPAEMRFNFRMVPMKCEAMLRATASMRLISKLLETKRQISAWPLMIT